MFVNPFAQRWRHGRQHPEMGEAIIGELEAARRLIAGAATIYRTAAVNEARLRTGCSD
jgi:hypothetical protein